MCVVSALGGSFGYHTNSSYPSSLMSGWLHQDVYKKQFFNTASRFNIHNIVGYLPLAGIYSGVCRISLLPQWNKQENNPLIADTSILKQRQLAYKALYITQVVRAIFEFLGIGVIFLLPDLLVTAVRHAPCCRQGPYGHSLL